MLFMLSAETHGFQKRCPIGIKPDGWLEEIPSTPFNENSLQKLLWNRTVVCFILMRQNKLK